MTSRLPDSEEPLVRPIPAKGRRRLCGWGMCRECDDGGLLGPVEGAVEENNGEVVDIDETEDAEEECLPVKVSPSPMMPTASEVEELSLIHI